MNILIVHETQTSVMRESKKPERGIWENKRGKWCRTSKKGKKGFSLKPSIWKTDVKRSCPPWREICWNSRSLMPPLLFAQFPFFQFLMHVRSLLHTIRSDTLDDDGSGVNLLPRDHKHFPERVFPDLLGQFCKLQSFNFHANNFFQETFPWWWQIKWKYVYPCDGLNHRR